MIWPIADSGRCGRFDFTEIIMKKHLVKTRFYSLPVKADNLCCATGYVADAGRVSFDRLTKRSSDGKGGCD